MILSKFATELYNLLSTRLTEWKSDATLSTLMIPTDDEGKIILPSLIFEPMRFTAHSEGSIWKNKPKVEIGLTYIDKITETKDFLTILDNSYNIFYKIYQPFPGWVSDIKVMSIVDIGGIDYDFLEDEMLLWITQRFECSLMLDSAFKTEASKFLNMEST